MQRTGSKVSTAVPRVSWSSTVWIKTTDALVVGMDCPNGCDCMQQSCPIRVDAETYVEQLAMQFPARKGVDACEPATRNGEPMLLITVDENAYETDGHFKHRAAFEDAANISVTEEADGRVGLVRHGTNIITALECTECGTVHEPDLDVVFENPDRMY